MLRFIFYVVLFYIIIKALNAFFRWWNQSGRRGKTSSTNGTNNSNASKYKDVEEAKFTEIKTDTKKERV